MKDEPFRPAGPAQPRAGETVNRAPVHPGPATSGLLPALSLPRGGGAIRGIGEKFSTNPVTGTGTLTIPIATSPGRAGFELGLHLGYDSGSGNGPFGIGWQLSTPAIARKTDKGLPRYIDADDSDVFVLSGAEDLVPVPQVAADGTAAAETMQTLDAIAFRVRRYRPRTEGAFARIERWTERATGDAHWRVITPDNVLSVYGRSRAARITDPGDPERVFSWLLEETRDDRGNVARYIYKPEDGAGVDRGAASEANRFDVADDGTRSFRATAQRYLKRIQYGNRTPDLDRDRPATVVDDDYLFEVVLDYGEHDLAAPAPRDDEGAARPAWSVRRDPFSSFRAGFEVRTYRLCRRVLMFHRFAELGAAPCLVRATELTYDEGPVVSYLVAATQAGFQRVAGSSAYERAASPPLELGYVRPQLHDELRTIDPESLEGIAGGIDDATAHWVDLDGEGIPGVLVPTERAWFYKANLGGGRFAPPALERRLPVPAELHGAAQLTDLGGDGHLDLVCYASPLPGYFERTADKDWRPFVPLHALPRIDWSDPNLRFVDLDGDGLPDVLITERDAFVWYRSRASDGFEPAAVVRKARDEQTGPAVVFADGTETIQLADMTGDGLADLVRVRNGEVCYWPNLGHGRFGRKVTLDRSPWFADAADFDPSRVRFADIDGSGTSDVVYLGRDGVRLYFNQSGNALSEAVALSSLPPVDAMSRATIVDLLGQGTPCLVWSSSLPGRRHATLAYIDLMGGRKPHLLERIANNLGGETRMAYAPSTRFYLADKAAGRPWLTRLAFPVHVIERVEHRDHVAATRLVTTFAYHHGYFDPHEREFRGFACVEQWDAESFSDERLDLPPARTVTWFHTGAWLDRERLELALATEYYQGDPLAPLLPDTILPAGLSVRDEREAARALRGQILRQEVYAEDRSPDAVHPYLVSERSHEVRLLHASASDRVHAVFLVHPRHSIELHYERRPADPRMQQTVVLALDDFGHVTRSAAIAYPRRTPVEPEQARGWIAIADHTVANRPDEPDWYRLGVPIETTTSELTGLAWPARGVLGVDQLTSALATAAVIPYEADAAGAGSQLRVVERERHLYYRDDLAGALPLGDIESRALAYETYRQVFTPGLLAANYGARVDDAALDEARYIQQDGAWWVRSGRAIVDPARFYLPVEAVDPFDQHTTVRYDGYALLVVEIEDALGNRVTAGARDATGAITQSGNDYRVLAAVLVTDPNRNRTAVALDARGVVVRTAVMGKDGAGEGDTLDDPTTDVDYDLFAWMRTSGAQPAVVHTRARERHGAADSRWQETYSYSDGSGREVQKKVQAEPGPVPILDDAGHLVRNPDGSPQMRDASPRWVGTGRTVFDNKGNAVKKYEPFFSATSDYEDERALVEWGVTPILHHDPLGRLVRTDQPNGTHARVVFDAWTHQTWDENDTVAGTPWLARKQAGTASERRCARLATAHAGTPAIAHLDALGRAFLTVADNGPAGPRPTRVELDIEGNQRSVTDARGNLILRQVFDMLSRPVRVIRADAGAWDAERQRRAVPVATDPDGERTLLDVAGKPVRVWTERGHVVSHRYDRLQRCTHVRARSPDAADKLVTRTVYGEAHPEAEARNLRAAAYQTYDGAGVVTSVRFDFHGHPLEAARRLAVEYHDTPDWSSLDALVDIADIAAAADPLLHAETFVTTTAYDALGRITSRTTPDASETRTSYNDAGLAEQIDVRIRGAFDWTSFVAGVDYNARGQRASIEYGNGVITTYRYDDHTFRLANQRTTRSSDGLLLQDLSYEYDPVGNIVEIPDAVSYGNPTVSATGLYEYDALYQLVLAEGREHPGQQPTDEDAPLLRLDHPNDLQALRRYRETYVYDPAGNIEAMVHVPVEPGGTGWTRRYAYASDNNRLLRTSAPGDPPGTLSATYDYDDAGNMTRMPHLPQMRWDHANRLQSVTKQVLTEPGSIANDVYFTYDASGERVRKIYEHSALVEERSYVGEYEIYREFSPVTSQLSFEKQTLHILDDERRVSLIETDSFDAGVLHADPSTQLRFQFDNQLSSSIMELDGSGVILSYEDYYAFGKTSFFASSSAASRASKRYRYTAMERDAETGLAYHHARYYASWLARWTVPDPLEIIDGLNVYGYCKNRPIISFDPTGTTTVPPMRRRPGRVRQAIITLMRILAGDDSATQQLQQEHERRRRPDDRRIAPGPGGGGSSPPAPPSTTTVPHHHADEPALTCCQQTRIVPPNRELRRQQARPLRGRPHYTIAAPHPAPSIPSLSQSSHPLVRAGPPASPTSPRTGMIAGAPPLITAPGRPITTGSAPPAPGNAPPVRPGVGPVVSPPTGRAPSGTVSRVRGTIATGGQVVAEQGPRVLRAVGLVSTFAGAIQEGQRVRSQFGNSIYQSTIGSLNALGTTALAVAAGLIDDALFPEVPGLVADSWRTHGSGPAQHLVGSIVVWLVNH